MKLERSSTLEEEPRLLDAAKVEQTTTPSEGTGDTTLQEKTILPENSKEERDIFEELYVDRPVLMYHQTFSIDCAPAWPRSG